MSSGGTWLPELLTLEDFGHDWERYFAAIHQRFEEDFRGPRPTFRGLEMGLKRHPEVEGMSATFWHMISEGKGERNREPDLRRCERIAWPMAMLREPADSTRVLSWEESDRRGRKVLLTLPDFSYLVVVDIRRGYVLPWTAYPIERSHQRRKLQTRYLRAKANPPPK